MEVSHMFYPLFALEESILPVPYLAADQANKSMKDIARILDEFPRHTLDCTPWPQFPYRPEVTFSIAYDSGCIYLKYYVTEETIQVRYNKTNDPVYKDSCVEFFIAFPNSQNYYNLEFNPLGTCRGGFGPGRDNRSLLSPQLLQLIRKEVVLNSPSSYNNVKNYRWQISLAIPVQVFSEHTIPTLKGMVVRANFYKCGDDLPKPHFLAWKNLIAPEPNFHLLKFFGILRFV